MSRIKIVAVMTVLLAMLLLIPTAFASENQTAFELSDNADEAIASDSYFDAGIANDTGNGTKDNPFKELTADRINDNSVIHLEDGQYYVNGYIDKYNLTFIGKSSQNTVISYADFSAHSSLTFKNLTLKSSTINVYGKLTAQNVIFSDSYHNNGGVIYSASDYSRIDIQNSTFENNNAQYGGAIYISGNGVLNVQDSIFKDNCAYHFGGAITAEKNANITIKKSKFINDYSTSDVGGAIYLRDSDRFIGENLEFVNCSATFGGAIIALNSNVTLTSINAYNNRAKYNGGAFYSMYGYITVKNSIFDNNSAENGGALFVDGAEIFNVYSNRFTNNIAQETAGGVYCFFSDIFYDSIFDEALNNSFSKNKAKNFSDAYKSDIMDIIIASGNYDLIQIESSTFNGTLPSKYDLRDYNQVTSVKNQGNGGNCWSFSSLAALESCILKATGKSYDLSEGNMKNIMSLFSDYGWGMAPNDGGYDDMGVGYLTSWLGPVYESEDAYYEKSVISPLLDSLIHVQNILFLSRSDYTDNDAIKKAIMDYGAVSSCIYWSGSYLKDRINYYNNGTSGSNHAVAIVGWDDNYPASKFNITPPGDGAWIIKNSWGTGSGNKGFYYVSYYDMKLATVNKSDVSFTFILNDTVRYDKNYQYDLPGRTDYFFNSSSTVWYKNKYRATANEYLAAVSTYFEKETSWNLSVYVNSVLKHVQSGKSPSSYSTIELSKMIPLKIGDFFEIEFEISVNGDAGVPISEAVSLNHKFYTENISHISYDGVNWADLYELAWVYPSHTYSSQVACIKAFTIVNADDDSQDIEKLEQSINAEHLDAYLNENYRFTVKILDKSGNALVDKKVSFSLNDETFSANTNRQGIAVLDYAFDEVGKYEISVSSPAQDNYMDSNSTVYFTVKSTIKLPSNAAYTLNSKYSVNLYDENGSAVNGEVTISIGANMYYLTCKNGLASLVLDLAPASYAVNITNPQTNESLTQTIKVVKRITMNKDLTMYYGAGSSYKVKVVNDYGKIQKNLKVTFKVNGRTYYAYTDSKGYASLKISLLPKTYKITATYKGFTVSNKITVKKTIITYDKKVKKGKTIKFTAKLLSSKGKILKYKKVTFKFKGKTYKVKTNSKGIATLKITKKYKVGKYTITTKYGSAKVSNKIKIVK